MALRADEALRADGAPAPHQVTLPGLLRRSQRPDVPKVSVVVPTLNEARNLPFALARLPECVTEVIIVDGHSTDDTMEIARYLRSDVRIVKETRKGKGIALQRGFEEATGDIIVMLDADGSADPAEIQLFVDALIGGADFAKGSRFLPGGGSIDLTFIRSLGNRALTGAVNMVCQTRYTDLCYGYNAFWRDCLEFVPVDVAGFEVETRLNMAVATAGLAVVEVPSHEFCRVHGTSNLHAVRDGLRVLRTIITSTAELRSGRQSVRSDASDADQRGATKRRSKNLFVVAGNAPDWVYDQTRHAAEHMTENGRVLVGFTDGHKPAIHLPGSVGGSTLLGISPAGFPIWTGRLRATLGFRRRIDNTVIVMFDQARPVMMLLAALSGRMRGEQVVLQDLQTRGAKQSSLMRASRRMLRRLATRRVNSVRSGEGRERAIAFAACGDDLDFAQLLVDTASSMAREVADGWRLILQSDHADVQRIVDASPKSDIISVESPPIDDRLITLCDVVIVRYGADRQLTETAAALGVPAVVVDHPTAQRVSRSFDGAWLARNDVSSIIVALECASGLTTDHGPSGPDARLEAKNLVAELRQSVYE